MAAIIDLIITGPFGSALHKSDYVDGGTPLINPMNIVDGKIVANSGMMVSAKTVERLSSFVVDEGDIIIARRGEMGRCAVVSAEETGWLCGTGSFDLRLSPLVNPAYVAHYLRSPYSVGVLIGNALGNTMPNLNQSILKALLIPLPPAPEQGRILDGVLQASCLLNKINSEQNALRDLVSATKAHILDLAIRGRLVPQNADDEPASVLLERVRTEKEILIKQGKVKRDKRESVIFRGEDNSYYEKDTNGDCICIDDDLPFDIPDGWIWCELQDCCIKEIKRGRSPQYADHGHVLSFAQKCNQKYGGINIGLALWIDDASIGRYADDEYMRNGDIIINSTGTGTLGRVGIYHDSDNPAATPIVPDSHVTNIRVSEQIDSSYVFFLLKAMQASLEEMGEGSTNQKELKPLAIQSIRLPLPPLAEQLAISKKIVEAFCYMDQIENELR